MAQSKNVRSVLGMLNEVGLNGATYVWLDKSQLNVDHTYQREKLRMRRVQRIANGLDWTAFGVLIVNRRPDGTYWILDGQHRWRGVLQLDDITMVPCLVFSHPTVQEEARAYLKMQGDRGPIPAVDQFKANLVVEDELSLKVSEMVEGYGYRVKNQSVGPIVRCVGAVTKAFRLDELACRNAFSAVPSIFRSNPLDCRVFTALFQTERYFRLNGKSESLSQASVRRPLVTLGPVEIKKKLKIEEKNTNNKGTQFAYVMLEMINSGRASNRKFEIPTQGLRVYQAAA